MFAFALCCTPYWPQTVSLHTDESILSGETLPSEKRALAVDDTATLAQRANMAHMGTLCVHGRGRVRAGVLHSMFSG